MTTPTSLSGPALGAVVKDEGVDGGDLQSCKDVSCEDVIQSCEDMKWMEDYGLECNVSVSVLQLNTFKDVLVRATHLVSRGKFFSLDDLCTLLHGAIRRTVDGDFTAASSEEYNMYVLEVLCEFVEFAVAAFSFLSSQPILSRPSISKLLEALSIALDSETKYYKLRKSRGMQGVQVLPWRLECVLQIPGVPVQKGSEKGGVSDPVHYFCANKGVTGEPCECCKAPLDSTDAVLVYLCWLLAKTAAGSGYEYMLRMLSSPRQLTLQILSSLLRPFCQLMRFKSGDGGMWRDGIQHMEMNFRAKFLDQCNNACFNLFQYLDAIVPEIAPKPKVAANSIIDLANQETFSVVLNQLHEITSWGVCYYGCNSELDSIRASLGRLQEKMWERLLEAGYFLIACRIIGAAVEATTLPPTSGNETLFSLKWLEEKQIISKLLNVYYRNLFCVSKVKQLLTNLAKAGVVIAENDFVNRVRYASQRPPAHAATDETWDAADLIVGAMLDILDISSYSAAFLKDVLEWLETRQAESAFNGPRILFVLKKLLTNDRDRRWERRFLCLLCKHASSVSEDDLLDCLNKVADHYHNTSQHVTGALKDSYMQMNDEQEKLLEACSNADKVTYVSKDLANGALNHTHLHIQKAETWKEKEIAVHWSTSPTLTKALAVDFSFSRHETAKECFDHLTLAQQLSVDFNPNECNILASAMTTAMSPELQTLEALKKESLLHCTVLQHIEELRENHARQYDDIKQKQHETLAMFLEACRKEEYDVILDALNQKAKVFASVKRARVSKDKSLLSEDILQRVLQNAGGAFKEVEVKLSQVEAKHKESLERLPNDECAVCMTEFSLKRKRACLDPCGHASACVDCATQEWKRTKSCPLCKTNIDKPIPVPHKLFF